MTKEKSNTNNELKRYLCIFFVLSVIFNNSAFAIITDEFVQYTLNKNLKIEKYKQPFYNDELIDENFVRKYKNENLITYQPINFENLKKIFVKIRPISEISTKSRTIDEGMGVEFVLAEDFEYKDKTYTSGTKINARIEHIITNDIYGMGGYLEIGDFVLDNNKLDTVLTKNGADRSLWVIPASYVVSSLFGVGSLLHLIRGGHAKIRKNKTYAIIINII